MLKLRSSIIKEILVLIRDKAGLAILFIMPMVLIFVMTLIQDSTFRKLDETSLPVLLVNEDNDSLGFAIEQGLSSTGFFSVITAIDSEMLSEEIIKRKVSDGEYQTGIIIREGASQALREKVRISIEKALLEDSHQSDLQRNDSCADSDVIIYFDPVIKNSIKQSITNALENFTSRIESKITFQIYIEEMAEILPENIQFSFKEKRGINIQEVYATNKYNEVLPNSVQHNVPAWTVFAMFFIIIPLTGKIIKERDDGSAMRLRLMPGSYLTVIVSKIFVYLVVCLIQFMLMLVVGMVFLPMLGLPALELGPHKGALLLIAISTALAATGYGVLLGTIATSHEQAASFGSVSVIILAALGGIFVPVYMMGEIMQKISSISPLNWGLEGFYDVFLRGAGIGSVLPQILYLTFFFIGTLLIANNYERFKNMNF